MAKRRKGLSKMDAVRQALNELGKDAQPLAIQEFVNKLGIKMETGVISSYKTTITKASASGNGRRKKKKGRPAGAAAKARPAGGISVGDIQTIKSLSDKLGADMVSKLAGVLAK